MLAWTEPRPQVQFRAASNVCDKLTEAELRLANLLEEVESRKAELGGMTVAELPVTLVLPEHNTRVKLASIDRDTIGARALHCCCSHRPQTSLTATTTTTLFRASR